MTDVRYLSKDALDLLSQGKNARLTTDELIQLQVHLKIIAGWADRVPQETRFFFVERQPVLMLPRLGNLSHEEAGIAAYLQPLHSQLCAVAVQVLWKTNQLIRTLCNALNIGDLIVAATMARSLTETAAAFGCESAQISQLWRSRVRQPAPDMASLEEFVAAAGATVGQILFGTKLKKDNLPATGIERTNILTLIDKAEKLSENQGIRHLYEVLCDAVHPSIGSNRCFWSCEPHGEEGSIFEFVTQRDAQGGMSDLPFTIGMTSLWSLTWLGWMWNLFDRTLKDLCLTAKIYELPAVYHGIVRPSKHGDYCQCGSTKRAPHCPHHFGRLDSEVDVGRTKPGTGDGNAKA